jgi:putative DNA primase/helicase
LKADGGYVVASPSLHSSGTRYEWLSSAVTDGELPDLPAWALNGAVAASVKATSSAKTGCGDVIHGGARNNTLASLAGTMKRRNMSPESIEAALLKENAVRCLPPLAESEVRKIAVSIGRYPVGPGAQLKSSDAKIAELAALPPDEYDRQRDAAAKELRVRKSTLDKLVQARHPLADSGTGQGTPLELEEPVPWPAPVDGRTLLNELVGGFTRYVVLPPHGATALALWTVFAHSLDCFAVAPRLALLSPEKRCGKTLTLTLLSFLVPRALLASSISLASLFRTVDKARPTLLLDEADTFVHMSDELRGVLNSGHSRAGAFVIRVVGDNFEPRKFSTWAAMAFGAIGRLPDALMDRSIIMLMVRKAPGETVRRFRQDRTEDLQVLARKAARWAADNAEALKGADPGIPGGLNDRAADNWRPLLAIADLSGGEWPDRARVAAVQLSAAGVVEDPSVRVRLLEDLRDMFSRARADRLTSADICDKLAAMEDRPWPEYRHGLPITPTQLAKLLKPFNITPSTIRIGKNVAKGYALSAMQDTFKRFSGAEAVTPLQPSRTEEDLTSSRGNILENVTPGGASKRLENTGLLRRNGSAIP